MADTHTWTLYILQCGDASLYTGITNNLEHRISQHRSGKGAKYTRGRGPLTLVYTEICDDHSHALQRELAVKHLSRVEKMKLVQHWQSYIQNKENGCMKKALLVHPDEISKKWIDRLADSGVDILGIHPVGGKQADQSLTQLLVDLETPNYRELLDYAAERGLIVEYEMHAATYLLPRDYFDTHPEYYRVDKEGVRTTKRNFCVSNSDALRIVVDNAVKLSKKLYRSNNSYYIWLDDGKDFRCYCEECAKLSPSDQQLLVMNAIIRELRKTDPNAKLAYLAYHATLPVPQKIKPEEGIFLEYAPMNRDMTQPVRNMTPEMIQQLHDLLAFFGKKDSRVLEYWYDNSMYSKWTKPPKAFTPANHLIPDDLEFYRSLGFETIASFACYLGSDYEELYGEPDIQAFIQ